MARSTRIKGNVVPIFKVSALTPAPSADFSADISSIKLTDGDGEDAITFSDFAEGKAPLAFEVEATMSFDAGSLFRYCWDYSGKASIPFTYARLGNTSPSASAPHFTGTLKVPAKTGWEAAASESDSDTFEVTMQIESVELKVS